MASWLGHPDEARRTYESVTDHALGDDDNTSPVVMRAGDQARAFSWHHALEADAIAATADTAYLRALADSIEMRSARSYYGRDWRLHHHVRGLIAMRARQYERAIAEFEQARWGVCGWSRSLQQIAEAALALHQPARAIVALRDAYKGPLDAMGRYLPRSEIDYWMALSFKEAGQRDSATVYADYVRRAWANADPPIKARLRALQ
jgi:tetratricopeptide (TPR) repeat protein